MLFRLSLFFKDALGRGKVRTFQQEGTVISADVQPGSFSAADRCELMATCGHEVSDRSGRRCAHCKKMPAPRHRHRGVARHLPTTARGRSSAGECSAALIGAMLGSAYDLTSPSS